MQERSAPRRSFDGHTLTTPWDKLHELYFVSYAFLNYLSTPFLFAEPGFDVAEGNPYFGAGKKWRRLFVKYPAAYPTHSRQQLSISTKWDCCSDSTMWLRFFRLALRTSVWNTRPSTESSFPRTDVLSAGIRSGKSRTVRHPQL